MRAILLPKVSHDHATVRQYVHAINSCCKFRRCHSEKTNIPSPVTARKLTSLGKNEERPCSVTDFQRPADPFPPIVQSAKFQAACNPLGTASPREAMAAIPKSSDPAPVPKIAFAHGQPSAT